MAFYVQADYDNFTAAIKKEDNARVKSLIKEREGNQKAYEQRKQEEILRQQEYARQEREEAERVSYLRTLERTRNADESKRDRKEPQRKLCPAEKAIILARKRRMQQLARPKTSPQSPDGGMTCAHCIKVNPPTVAYPRGREGKPYCPGIDRCRFVPPPPSNKDLPPWVGSHQSHYSVVSEPFLRRREAERADFYCSEGRQHSEEEKRERRRIISSLVEEMNRKNCARTPDSQVGPYPAVDDELFAATRRVEASYQNPTPSIFSHADSNEPIEATGTQHFMYESSKEEIREHLRKYKGAIVGPREQYVPDCYVKDMSLPQLQERIIRLQDRTKLI